MLPVVEKQPTGEAIIEPKIINISRRELTNDEIRLLKRGLKFTPIPKQNKEFEADLQEFQMKLRLLEYFNNHQSIPDNSMVKNKSNFVPAKSNNEYLTVVLDALLKIPESTPPLNRKKKISRAENTALNQLKNDDSIIIKAANKQ